MSDPTKIEMIRYGLVKYGEISSKGRRRREKGRNLLSFLRLQTGDRKLSLDEVKDSFLIERNKPTQTSINLSMRDRPVFTLVELAEYEQESLNRIGKILGKQVHKMSVEELEMNAMRMFLMGPEEYVSLTENLIWDREELDINKCYHNDGLILLGVSSKIHGVDMKTDLPERILREDFSRMGYFQTQFEDLLEYELKERLDLSSRPRTTLDIRSIFRKEYNRAKTKLGTHVEFDRALRGKHVRSAPKLLEDRTLLTGVRPLTITFRGNDELVVLGQGYNGEYGIDSSDRFMTLQVYNISTSELMLNVETDIIPEFEGSQFGGYCFEGNVSVCSNDQILASGKRITRRIDREGNIHNLMDDGCKLGNSIRVLEEEGYFKEDHPKGYGYQSGIFQVVEDDDVCYFFLRPNQFSINHGNVLIATNGEKIIGEPVQFNIEANSVVGDTPRMALHEDRIYFRSGEDLVSVDKRLSGKPVNVIDGSVQMYRGPPASHCIDNEGLIWAITQVHGEEAPSIKAHNSTGEILTHIYPENFPSGWPSNRSMALNSEGLLAYTDPLRDRIHFYQI